MSIMSSKTKQWKGRKRTCSVAACNLFLHRIQYGALLPSQSGLGVWHLQASCHGANLFFAACRFFFEELRGCGDVNAAAASALRRLADARGSRWVRNSCIVQPALCLSLAEEGSSDTFLGCSTSRIWPVWVVHGPRNL